MTSHSQHSGSEANDRPANWHWLQERLKSENAAQLSRWLAHSLDELEVQFAALMTPRSRAADMRCELKRDDSRS